MFPSTIVVIFVPGFQFSKPQKTPIEHMVKMRTIWVCFEVIFQGGCFPWLQNIDSTLKAIVILLIELIDSKGHFYKIFVPLNKFTNVSHKKMFLLIKYLN
jgi:hypothetical protein